MSKNAWVVLLFCLSCLGACTGSEPVVPTLRPVAAAPSPAPATPTPTSTAVSPTASPTLLALLPAPTSTPPIATTTPSPTTARTATFAPTPLPPSPTLPPVPEEIPPYTVIDQIVSPFLETPPRAVACDGSGVVFRSRFPSDYGGNRYYSVYLPPCYGLEGRAYPVLYLFHGSIQTDSHWIDLGVPELMDAGIASGAYPPFIVIMPHNGEIGNKPSGGERSIEGITVNALLPYVDATYCTWAEPAGRSIGGISRGGYWALMIAFRHPELFTAVSGHSSHLRYETDKAEYNPLSTYATADLGNMRIWLDWGEKDFLYFGQKTLHESLAAAGIPHDVYMNEGGHNVWYWLDHVQEYIDWHAASWPVETAVYRDCP